MDNNRPKQQPVEPSQPVVAPPQPTQSTAPVEPLNTSQQSLKIKKPRLWLKLALGLIGLLLLIAAAATGWYLSQLRPVDSADQAQINLEIQSGMMPSAIADHLDDQGLIRSPLAFTVYTRIHGVHNQLQAGNYQLSPSMSTADIVDNLTNGGQSDILVVTFVPGATLYDHTDRRPEVKQDISTTLGNLGYDQAEIDAALEHDYDLPQLFASKPAGSSLEGYIYGDTYHFDVGTPVQTIIQRALVQMQTVITENDLVAAYENQGLTLYEGITLASIIQREVSGAEDQRQVSQIFFRRLSKDMPLGSDVTAYYGAEKAGKRSAVSTDTPYNTRMHTGLPPGPIATPGLSALLAVANPAPGDYEYFVSGDDGKNYFSHTFEEHNRNIELHCHVKCAME